MPRASSGFIGLFPLMVPHADREICGKVGGLATAVMRKAQQRAKSMEQEGEDGLSLSSSSRLRTCVARLWTVVNVSTTVPDDTVALLEGGKNNNGSKLLTGSQDVSLGRVCTRGAFWVANEAKAKKGQHGASQEKGTFRWPIGGRPLDGVAGRQSAKSTGPQSGASQTHQAANLGDAWPVFASSSSSSSMGSAPVSEVMGGFGSLSPRLAKRC